MMILANGSRIEHDDTAVVLPIKSMTPRVAGTAAAVLGVEQGSHGTGKNITRYMIHKDSEKSITRSHYE